MGQKHRWELRRLQTHNQLDLNEKKAGGHAFRARPPFDFRDGLYPGFCPPLAEMEDHFSDAATGRPSRACAQACASSALRPTALLPTGFGYARDLAVSPVGSYPTFSPLPSCEGGIFCATFRRRGLWSSPPRLSTGITLYGVRKFLQSTRTSDPPAVPEIYCAAAATSCSRL